MSLLVRVGGRPLSEVGPHSSPVYETLADGGSGDASWTMRPEFGRVHWAFLEGAQAEIFESGVRVWNGTIDEIDREEGGVTCRGRWFDGDYIPALTTAGMVTTSVADAMSGAQGMGWGVSRGDLSTGTVTGEITDPPMITDFLRMYADQQGKRVGVDGGSGAYLYLRSDPTTPTWVVTAPGVELSGTDRGAVNALKGRYVDSAGALRTVTRPAVLPARASVRTVDLTPRGALTLAQAQSILDATLSKLRIGPRWTNGVEVPLSQIQRFGGGVLSSPVHVVAGDMVRFTSLSAAQRERAGAAFLDVVLGRVVIDGDSDVLYLEPVGVVEQSLEEVVEGVPTR